MEENNKWEELLSAYLDGELSFDERKKLEEKVKSSKTLQRKLTELERIKNLTSSAYKRIEPNPYFETRLFADLNSKKSKFTLKKWAPTIAFVALTAIVMLVLKLNPNLLNRVVNSQKTNIETLYSSNLKPLLASVGLSNEDVFNFAVYKQLPIDKSKNQYLQVGSDPNGEYYVEIKSSQIPENINLQKFVKALNLNDRQKDQVDSILGSYASKLQSQVFVNDKNNSLAINSNLWNYHKAILADIMAYAHNANRQAFDKMMPAGYRFYSEPAVAKIVHDVKTNPDSQFIFVTPDSIFSKPLRIDQSKLSEELKKMSEDLNKNLKNLAKNNKNFSIKINLDSTFVKFNNDSTWRKNYKVSVDTNGYKIHIPGFTIPRINVQSFQVEIPNLDSLGNEISKAFENFKWEAGENPGGVTKSFKFKYEKGDTTLLKKLRKGFLNFSGQGQNGFLDSLMKLNKGKRDSVIVYGFDKNGNKLYINVDSLMHLYRVPPIYSDSLFFHNQKEFEKQMKELQKEMQNFREEMKDFQKNFHTPKSDNQKQVDGKKSVVI